MSNKQMKYNRLGKHGIKLSELSFGAWLTFGPQMDLGLVKACMKIAVDAGVNFFDNAEAYAEGQAEVLMGEALKDYRREDLVVSTKIFWGGSGPNDTGLSWKHLMEGTRSALRRLQLDYVDLLYCHRPDPDVPMDEVVRAMDCIVRSGKAFYWGTSEWPAPAITEAHQVARDLGCIPPAVEQPQYNMLARERVEKEYHPLCQRLGMGLTTWSPLYSGLLTGKYAAGVPAGSRLDRVEWLKSRLDPKLVQKVRGLEPVARELGCSLAQLAIAWCLRNPDVTSVILGASHPDQLRENLAALEVRDRLDAAVLSRLDKLLK